MAEAAAVVAHQFDDAEQQRDSVSLGMWLFLIQEIMFFGGLFLGYTVYRYKYSEAFRIGSNELELAWGGINTVVLIFSSLTMALAVHAAQLGKRKAIVAWLLATILLGSVFLGIKGIEYTHKFEHHLVPGPGFHYEGSHARQVQLFFSFYFVMTGMHALHMVIGVGLLAVLVWMAQAGKFDSAYYSPVEMTGLYWHFVDIVWIFLFPLLYLLGRDR